MADILLAHAVLLKPAPIVIDTTEKWWLSADCVALCEDIAAWLNRG
jgi:hypothetical protein